MTEIERYQIKAYLTAGYTQKTVAYELNRTPSTISRELKRNKGLRGYRPQLAQRLANERKQRHSHLKTSDATWRFIVNLLKEDWSHYVYIVPDSISVPLRSYLTNETVVD